ncbi:(deoxy)nucleoside triphosphate pyrophosphohydrolase [Altererythrobacter ishigakiensis]|uniref:8-oxo-dGTP diphosphatase n=1 Tax=Altererythrobacter ishigakiensis TaxID=476157 RepID=A0A562UW30_9SPHN|nr:(deoxy)nucleoside triphosphate pyrophosphohydrolase [Altererythrobacter ishigakiensis]TWJ09797.1 8-oxo-dGTP diphosphatase [Altererythrobacter ishigakiensis]
MKQVAAAIAISEGKVLVTRRAAGQKLAGFWEFPGGKLEPGEDVQMCIVRELQEELGVTSTAGEVLTVSEYTYPGGAISLIAVEVSLHSSEFTLTVHDEYAWKAPGELLALNLAPADIPIARQIQEGATTQRSES